MTAESLAIYGQTFFATGFVENVEEYAAFGEPRWLPVETMKACTRRGRLQGFLQQYSQYAEMESVRGARFEFEPEEVLWLKWPKELPPRQGRYVAH